MKIGIFGLPNSGKSQFRREFLARLREAGKKAEHWDADRFTEARCPEDLDMLVPPEEPDRDTFWLIEDVRGTMLHRPVVEPGEKEGAWKPLSFYDAIFYLSPPWETYALFWISRVLKWQKTGRGFWSREKGWESLDTEAAILDRIQFFLADRGRWIDDDLRVLRMPGTLSIRVLIIHPVWQLSGKIWWQGFDLTTSVDDLLKQVTP